MAIWSIHPPLVYSCTFLLLACCSLYTLCLVEVLSVLYRRCKVCTVYHGTYIHCYRSTCTLTSTGVECMQCRCKVQSTDRVQYNDVTTVWRLLTRRVTADWSLDRSVYCTRYPFTTRYRILVHNTLCPSRWLSSAAYRSPFVHNNWYTKQ